jgi:GNAT superfamily N-acetyltransferase
MKLNEILADDGKKITEINGVKISVEWVLYDDYGVITAKAYKDGLNVGGAHLESKGKNKPFQADDLYVIEQYRKQGIARTIYDYIEKLGFKIEISNELTPDGQAFWKSRKNKKY